MITTIGKQIGKLAFKVEVPVLQPSNLRPLQDKESEPWGESGTVWTADRDLYKEE